MFYYTKVSYLDWFWVRESLSNSKKVGQSKPNNKPKFT